MINSMLTQNTDQLRQEVAAHVAADTIIQGDYWDDDTKSGCFIGCLAKCGDPIVNEITYGLPVMLQRIAESIFERLPADDAKDFFAALPEAISCDGKDLTKVSWQFLAANLRSLSNCSDQIQAVINPVIRGMDLLASGQEWDNDDADAAYSAYSAAATTADNVADNAAVKAAYSAAKAAAFCNAAHAIAAAKAAVSAIAASATATAACNAAVAIAASATAYATAYDVNCRVVRLRQRDLLLRLISEAPVVRGPQ